jgi:hypothetical protein
MNFENLEIVRCGQDKPFGNYRYRIQLDGNVVAEIEHSYRGDENFMRSPGGNWEATDRSLEGGGPEPIRLTKSGMRDLSKMVGGNDHRR